MTSEWLAQRQGQGWTIEKRTRCAVFHGLQEQPDQTPTPEEICIMADEPLSASELSINTVGARLRAAREAKEITLAQVAERTKVRPGILTAIEEDDHDSLPALTYTLGFIKAYARTVGIDPNEISEAYREESQKEDPVPTLVDMAPLENERIPSPRLIFISAAIIVLVLAGFWAWGAGWLTSTPPSRPTTEDVADSTAVEEQAAENKAALAEAEATPDTNATVTLKATNEVWLRISEGSEDFFSGTLKPGEELTLPKGHQWALRTGRAGAIELKVGDKTLPPLGGPAEQIHNKILTPAALLGLPEDPATASTATPTETGPKQTGLAPTRIIEGANPDLSSQSTAN